MPAKQRPPTLQGEILAIDGELITLERNPGEKENSGKGYCLLQEWTEIYLQRSDELEPLERTALKCGMYVKVWYDGVTIMIYPPRVPADRLIVEM